MNRSNHLIPKIQSYLNEESKQILPQVLDATMRRYKTVMENQFGSGHKPRTEESIRLYPSEAGKCERAIFYKALGIPGEPFSPDARFKFVLGDLVELTLIYILGHALKSPDSCYDNNVRREVQIGRLKWDGYTDGIVKTDGVRRNLEVKSTSKWGFKATQNKGVDNAFGYLTQASVYTRCLYGEGLIDVPETVFLYVDRDSMHRYEETVRFDRWDLAVEADEKFNRILDAIEAKRVPQRPYGLEKGNRLGLQCRYCSHKYTCWVNPHQAVKFDEHGDPVYRENPSQYVEFAMSRGKPIWQVVGV